MGRPRKYTRQELIKRLIEYIHYEAQQNGGDYSPINISLRTLQKHPIYSDIAFLSNSPFNLNGEGFSSLVNQARQYALSKGDFDAAQKCRMKRGVERIIKESSDLILFQEVCKLLQMYKLTARHKFTNLPTPDAYLSFKTTDIGGKVIVCIPKEAVNLVQSLEEPISREIRGKLRGTLLNFLNEYKDSMNDILVLNGVVIRYDTLVHLCSDIYNLILRPRIETEELSSKMDDELLLRARLGDRDVANQIVKQSENSIVKPASWSIKEPGLYGETREYLNQRAREAVFSAIRNFDWRGPFGPYAMVCAQNEVKKVYHTSQTKRRLGHEIPFVNDSDENEFGINLETTQDEKLFYSADQIEITLRDQTQRIFWSEFKTLLTDEEKRIFALREKGKTPQEISEIYGVSRTTIQNRIITAFGKLRESPKLLRLYEELSS